MFHCGNQEHPEKNTKYDSSKMYIFRYYYEDKIINMKNLCTEPGYQRSMNISFSTFFLKL